MHTCTCKHTQSHTQDTLFLTQSISAQFSFDNFLFSCHHESICERLTLFELFFLPYFCSWHTWNSNNSWNLQIWRHDAHAQLLFFPTSICFFRLSAVSRQERIGTLCCSAATKMLQLGTEPCAWGFSDFQQIRVVLNNFNITVDFVWHT